MLYQPALQPETLHAMQKRINMKNILIITACISSGFILLLQIWLPIESDFVLCLYIHDILVIDANLAIFSKLLD